MSMLRHLIRKHLGKGLLEEVCTILCEEHENTCKEEDVLDRRRILLDNLNLSLRKTWW